LGFGNDEIDFRFSAGEIPAHPKPTSRMVGNPMGDAVRLAEKYWCAK